MKVFAVVWSVVLWWAYMLLFAEFTRGAAVVTTVDWAVAMFLVSLPAVNTVAILCLKKKE